MVCSRERSETHFLMNSFSNSILHIYPISQLWPVPNGSFVNFSEKTAVTNFLRSLSCREFQWRAVAGIKHNQGLFFVSHLDHTREGYIYRGRLLKHYHILEILSRLPLDKGRKAVTPLELEESKSSSQSQRHQSANDVSYFLGGINSSTRYSFAEESPILA